MIENLTSTLTSQGHESIKLIRERTKTYWSVFFVYFILKAELRWMHKVNPYLVIKWLTYFFPKTLEVVVVFTLFLDGETAALTVFFEVAVFSVFLVAESSVLAAFLAVAGFAGLVALVFAVLVFELLTVLFFFGVLTDDFVACLETTSSLGVSPNPKKFSMLLIKSIMIVLSY